MKIPFIKMHALGNDFMLLDGINQQVNLDAIDIASLAQRHTGIGFDQCLVIEPSTKEGIDFNYRIFNADGHEVGQCGNGARCLALFAKHYGLSSKNTMTVATNTTQMTLHIHSDKSVSIDMGTPILAPAKIPLLADTQRREYTLPLKQGQEVSVHALSVGNPHAVLVISDRNTLSIEELGSQISVHPAFPEQTNVGFMHILNPQHIQLRVYERGCGETLACGSGAVAAAAVGRLYYNLLERVTVSLPGGDVVVDWPEFNNSITLTGPATFVYEGVLF